MESLYPKVVNILISIGDINTLSALWKEISYVPSLFYLKDLINKSVSAIADILSLKYPEINLLNWRVYPETILMFDFSLDLYEVKEKDYNNETKSISPFAKLVNRYDEIFLSKLIDTKDLTSIMNFVVNNRRMSNKFLKIFLNKFSGGGNAPSYGPLVYQLLINNKQIEEKRLPVEIFNNRFTYTNDFVHSFYLEAQKEGNYYPILIFQKPLLLERFNELNEFYLMNVSIKNNKIHDFIFDFIEARHRNCHEIVEMYISREDVSEKEKTNFAKVLTKRLLQSRLVFDKINLSFIKYDRTFHNYFIFCALEYPYFSIHVKSIILKYGSDPDYDPYKFERKRWRKNLERVTKSLEEISERDEQNKSVKEISKRDEENSQLHFNSVCSSVWTSSSQFAFNNYYNK